MGIENSIQLLYFHCLCMKIIIGLGNPGRRYIHTRHNIGFMVADELARIHRIDLKMEKFGGVAGWGRIGSEDVVILKPQTYMNESGRAASAALRWTHAEPGDLFVIHDDLDLPLADVRVKTGGGHGGHNGLRSIMEQIASPEFVRIRFGIGRPYPGIDASDYVLSPFLPEERQAVAQAIELAAEAVRVALTDGIAAAMNRFNRRHVTR